MSGENNLDEEKQDNGEDVKQDEVDNGASDEDSGPQTKKRKLGDDSKNNENPSKKARLEIASTSVPSIPQPQASSAAVEDSPSTDPPKPSKPPSCTHNIPRLLSVTEIIKREYLASLEPSFTTLVGLHQYNYLGFLEGPEINESTIGGGDGDEEKRAEEIIRVLSGKNQLVPCLYYKPGMRRKN